MPFYTVNPDVADLEYVGGHTAPISLIGSRTPLPTHPARTLPIAKSSSPSKTTTQPVAKQAPNDSAGSATGNKQKCPAGYDSGPNGCIDNSGNANTPGGNASQQSGNPTTQLPPGTVDTNTGCTLNADGTSWTCPYGTAGPSNGWQVPGPPASTSPNAADCTQDAFTCALLAELNGANASGMGNYNGLGIPTGTIGSATQASSGPNPLLIIVVVALGVLGYYLWHKYKGKLSKHEESK